MLLIFVRHFLEWDHTINLSPPLSLCVLNEFGPIYIYICEADPSKTMELEKD